MSKQIHPMKKAGWEMVDVPSHIIDSIWTKDKMLNVKFATGQSFTFGEIKS